ncbi:MAG: hypothetical protein J6K24_05955 [Tidjanibacter sp.]|nr:hypothetical protein [Tidjanibacter sp.]
MSIKSNIPQIAALRMRVERRFGKPLATHADFLALVDEIEKQQRQHISESTLERVWGYSTRGYDNVSLRTLDVLAFYGEGVHWAEFCALLAKEAGDESEFFDSKTVTIAELTTGDVVRIGWLPDRLCEVRYLGEGRFVAERCENSTMRPGDSFECLEFVLGKPLSMCNFCREGIPSGTYVAGKHHGLTTLHIL